MAVYQTDIAGALAELNKLSNEELKELCNSSLTDKYDELISQSDKIKSLEAEREMLMASVKSLAEFNLAKQSDYESDRAKLLAFVGDSNKLKEDIQTKAATLLELSKKTSLESTLSVVLSATATAEEESERISKSFLENSINYDTFLSQYSEKRKLAHLRRIKADRLRQETNESWTGHTGIGDSEGKIYDFGASYYIAIDNFTFGRPTKYLRLAPDKVRGRDWNDAIQVSASKFREQSHNIFGNNCHRHVADTLNEMKYNGRDDYTQFDVFLMVTFMSEYVGFRGFFLQWGLWILLLITLIVLFSVTR